MTRVEDVPEEGALAKFLSVVDRRRKLQAWARRESSIGRASPMGSTEALLTAMSFELD